MSESPPLAMAGAPHSPPARWGPRVALFLCLALFTFLSWRTATTIGPTFDEPAHLADGWLSLKTGDYSVNPEHPPLAKQWAALPLLFREDMPTGDLPAAVLNQGPWDIARALFFSRGSDFADSVLHAARRQALLFGIALILAIYGWSSRLWGQWAGVFSAALACFCPTLIAHASLIHTDVPATLGFVLVGWLSWQCYRGAGWGHVVCLGLALGFTLAVKFNGILAVPPVVLLLAASRPGRKVDPSVVSRAPIHWTRLARIAVVLAIAWHATVVEYGWPPDLQAYYLGMRSVYKRVVPGYEYFFFGKFSKDGFWQYLLGAMAVKTPIPGMAAWVLAIAIALRGRLRRALIPLAWAAYLLCAISELAANIGVRYALPVYVMLHIFAGAFLAPGLGMRWIRAAAAVAVLGCAGFIGIRSVPDGIAYFNPIGGPPEKAIRLLDDSNLDWGQTIPQVVEYVRSHPGGKIYLCWFSFITPLDYGVRCPLLFDNIEQVLMPDEATYIVTPQILKSPSVFGAPGLTFDWLQKYRPSQILGQSVWVYRFGYSDDGRTKFEKKTGIQWIDPVPVFQSGIARFRNLAQSLHEPTLLGYSARGSIRLGVWLRDHKRFDEAGQAFLEARTDGGPELSIAAGLALLYGEQGKFEKAQEEIERLRKLSPNNPQIDGLQRELDAMKRKETR